MSSYVLPFQEIKSTQRMLAGGKGANLGELCRIASVHVPDGFCLSTTALQSILENVPAIRTFLDQLSLLKGEDREGIHELSRNIRKAIEEIALPHAMQAEITDYLARYEANQAWAIRSSATAEDLPTASFAGQQDTFLNIRGKASVFRHISKCWSSLFTERAILYRLQNGFDHRQVQLAVVVQQMVFPQAAGVLFTADPLTAHRKVSSIAACFGLGEALVSGLVDADTYTVRRGALSEKRIATKKLATVACKDGGTETQEIARERQHRQVLSDEQIEQLERIGRTIEAHYSCPQDIEWCLVDETFFIVQARPITTLYPIPARSDQENHVYISVGHQQMMTDAMKPLGWSFFQMTAATAMFQAGGRLFVDVAPDLASPVRRNVLLNVLGKSDQLIKGALTTLIEREDAMQAFSETPQTSRPGPDFQVLNDYDPTIVSHLMQQSQASIDELKRTIQSKTGIELLDFILEDLQLLKKSLADPQSFGVFMTAMNAATWLNEKMQEWLGEKSVADTLSQAVPHNVTSAMGLALLDVADVIRPYPEVVAYLQQTNNDDFLDELLQLQGGSAAREAISAFLNSYGMRCAGEIDITRPRWSEKPTTLLPTILSHIKNAEPGASKRRFEQGQQEALAKEQELLTRLQTLPDSETKISETKRMITLLRNFIGYREYPKYAMINRYFVYKQALLQEAERLVQAGVLREKAECYYLTFAEFHEVVRTKQMDRELLKQRKDEHQHNEKLTPPRVMTSDGEIIASTYKRDSTPGNALAGLPVSAGIVEGRARIILKMEDADLQTGDILVTTFTDPSWTPLFVSIKGLVTEVGGLMTHGAVIAREYGIPAVVNVEHATQLIRDGQIIRINGTEGYVEIL